MRFKPTRLKWPVLCALLLSVGLFVLLGYGTANQVQGAHGDGMYYVDLDPLNESGVEGWASLELMGDQLTVTIEATGVEANMLHPQHIHGFTETMQIATCPTPAADMNDDNLVDLAEGLPAYGNVLLPLEPFPMAADGSIDFQETYTVNIDDLGPLDARAIVLHGMTTGGGYQATLPVACGQVMKAEPVTYMVDLGELNDSGVDGTATLVQNGNQLTVSLMATGLEQNMLHPQHIHGFTETMQIATCPTPAADMNDDGLVDLAEGLPDYGNVLLPLEPFPMAADGSIDFEETYTITLDDLAPLHSKAIVLHGMTTGEGYQATLPVACGQIMRETPVEYFQVDLGELNDSGVSGMALLARDGDRLTVKIDAMDLEPDALHPQHIHGFTETTQIATCPTLAADANNDGLVDLAEGLPDYGNVLLPLEPFPMAAGGSVMFEQSYLVDPAMPLDRHAIVLHGMTVDGNYEATLPVACGQVEPLEQMTYSLDLGELNDSGVTGQATITLTDGMLDVHITANNLEANMTHPQHIHGLDNALENATCPPLTADANDDGVVDLGEGVPFYGGVLLPLQPYPTAPDGSIHFDQSYDVNPLDLLPLENRVIVLHGMTVDDTYEATLPVACGQIEMQQQLPFEMYLPLVLKTAGF